MGTEAGEAGAHSAGSGGRRFSRSGNGGSEGNGTPLSETLAGEVRQLLGASEEAARAIRNHAVAEADALRDALRREIEETRRDAATRAQAEIAAVVGESLRRLSARAAAVDASLDELRSEANRFAADLTELGARLAPETGEGRAMVEDERRGRLIALTMAINGASREETARYLEENLQLSDVGSLLDSVYR